ncbi:MAG: Carboxymethylenebutenolidase [Candidatus Collierbacteria bacterium GW2011_GWB1_44_6]|uniref:Carboxymethylenebutenolidase n=1 Tax=Candidatus Collierbacteria bacterium GW2011_GWB1_44_6 TaxID=1618384 RepID=A0A0G1JPV6_9BACT|nr:MAG: Carboxymethylenebutenolidase [Candidatus Collierbacteria bacterium GW2011_GWB1_44_6]
MAKTTKPPKAAGVLLIVLAFVIAGIYLFQRRPEKMDAEYIPQQTVSQMITPGLEKVITANVNYYGNSVGYYAEPDKEGSYPGVVMIHEWWGLNDGIKDMAKSLSSNGYRVLAVDLYGGKVAQNMQEAQGMVSSVKQPEALANMRAAKKFLNDKGATKVASFGWCFGGGQSLQLSLAEKDLSATVIYYGALATDSAKLKNIKWPVLGIFGDQDRSISVESVRAFQANLNKDKTVNEIYIYSGVGHAFANPSNANYAPEETKDAWGKTVAFLEKYLR